MRNSLFGFAALAVGLGLLGTATGCEASSCSDETAGQGDAGVEQQRQGDCVQLKSLKRFNGIAETKEAVWASGAPVTISSRNGNLLVKQGTEAGAGKVSVLFEPFVLRAYDTPEDQIAADIAMLNQDVVGDAGGVTGAVEVSVTRDSGAKNTLGSDMTVSLPPEFNGALTIQQDNGSTGVQFAGAASSVSVTSSNGSCELTTGTAATGVNANCDNGDLTASIGGVPIGATGGTFVTGNGEIALSFPSGAVFNVQALALAGGSVDTGNAESAGCTVQVANESSKTVSCNGATSADPTYKATANGTSLANVVLSF